MSVIVPVSGHAASAPAQASAKFACKVCAEAVPITRGTAAVGIAVNTVAVPVQLEAAVPVEYPQMSLYH